MRRHCETGIEPLVRVDQYQPWSSNGIDFWHPTRRAEQRWPALAGVHVRYRGVFGYIDGQLPGRLTLPLCRLRFGGSASTWAS